MLRRRLAILAAAPTLANLEDAPGRVHALRADREGQFAMSLWGATRLVFEPQGLIVQLAAGGVDRRHVVAVVILAVVDYHGD